MQCLFNRAQRLLPHYVYVTRALVEWKSLTCSVCLHNLSFAVSLSFSLPVLGQLQKLLRVIFLAINLFPCANFEAVQLFYADGKYTYRCLNGDYIVSEGN